MIHITKYTLTLPSGTSKNYTYSYDAKNRLTSGNINGKILMENKKLINIKENEIYIKCEEIINRIYAISRAKLIECLKDPDGTDLWLINYISEATHPTGKSQNGNMYKARTNVSFASKFCHYACFYLFEGEAEQDNYSIFDYVLRKVLPKYISHYRIKSWNLDDYSEYRKAVDDILRKANARISRNGFDHLLWYYFKGRL